MTTDKIIRYVYYLVIAVLAIVGLWMIMGSDESSVPNVDFSLWQGIIYAGVATGFTLIFAVINMITHFRGSVKAIISVVVLAALYFIGRGMAGSEIPQKMADNGISLGTLQASEAGVWVSGALIVIAIVITSASFIRGLVTN